jgi:hypothetical protein
MSYKDLEKAIKREVDKRIANITRLADKKADKKRRSDFKKTKAKRPPMYRPDSPAYKLRVVLNVRYQNADGTLGDLEEKHYDISTISSAVAEVAARSEAKKDGYVWRGTVSIEPK